MKHLLRKVLLSLVILTVLLLLITLLFYSQSCPHCHKVVTEDLPPLFEKYSDQLVILGIDTSTALGYELYEAAIRYFQIPSERLGVPTVIIGETVLVGSFEIPEQFPGLINEGLAAGGINWPDFPEMQKLLESEGISDAGVVDDDKEPGVNIQNEPVDDETSITHVSEEEPLEEEPYSEEKSLGINTNLEGSVSPSEQLTLAERFARDKTGNTISVIVLIGMALSVLGVGTRVSRSLNSPKPWPRWVVPILVLIGMVVAIYMGYVEVTETEAVCGPVGDCNTVQQSSYATLFGIIPIGIFGLAGYLVIGFVWLIAVFGPKNWRNISALSIWIFSVFGALFSIYLTFLEPFVIGATCAWCLTSAIVMHLLLWATTAPAIKAWNEYRSITS